MEIFSFFAGIVFFYTQANLIGVVLLLALYLGAPYRCLIAFFVAIGFAALHDKVVEPHMPKALVIANARLEGIVASIPKITPDKLQFQYELSRLNNTPVQATLWMVCFQPCPTLKVGEAWRFEGKIKQPQAAGNPGGFQFKNWLTSNHLSFTGAVKGASAVRLSSLKGIWHFQSFRERLAFQLESFLKNDASLGLIQGLTLGVASHIDKSQWDLFRRTGTTHLVVISGEHIGLIAGFFFLAIQFIWVRLGQAALYSPAPRVAGMAAFVVAALYAWLTGLGAPVERALIAFGFVLLKYFLSQRFTPWQALRYALGLIVFIEPHTVLTPGFYLSFLAVAILMSVGRRCGGGYLKQMFQLQSACLVGLMPVTLYCFSYGALNGYVVNLIAIPWVGLVIVPTALIGLLLIQIYPWSGWLWLPKVTSHVFYVWLVWCDKLESLNLAVCLPYLSGVLAILLGMGLWVVMPIRTCYPLYALLIYAGYFPSLPTIKLGEASVEVLDVGQGLAVLIRTARHQLLYDTGGAFYKGGDWASLAILPYFKFLRLNTLDAIIISHPDLDHRGGLKTLESHLAVKQLIVNDPSFYGRGLNCHEVSPFTWDGVYFKFFPLPESMGNKNNRSCVLQIQTQGGRMLLTGDIEAVAEAYLVSYYQEELLSDGIVVPHHGSKTSSSVGFIQQVNPKFAIISSGFDNRFHFPHDKTVKLYESRYIRLLNTAQSGLIKVRMGCEQVQVFY